jgi:RNA polymerase sigma factor (sigma-70 family)
MDDLLKLVRTYRLTKGLAERLRLAESIFRLIEPDLRFFVHKAIRSASADDVLQEVLKAVAMSLGRFTGDTLRSFWAWCYRIARNKISDYLRKEASQRVQPKSHDELAELVEASAQDAPLSHQDRLDLEYAMRLLTRAKPECYDYLWRHFVFGLDYAEIAEEQNLSYDNVRMRIGRCLEEVKSLVA